MQIETTAPTKTILKIEGMSKKELNDIYNYLISYNGNEENKV